jgi:hypothetical protein
MSQQHFTPEEFRDRAKPLLGGRGWRKRLAAAIGVDYATVKRWTSDQGKVPVYMLALIEALEMLDSEGYALPERFAYDAKKAKAKPKDKAK